jgi:hypothetical protein
MPLSRSLAIGDKQFAGPSTYIHYTTWLFAGGKSPGNMADALEDMILSSNYSAVCSRSKFFRTPVMPAGVLKNLRLNGVMY